MTSNTGAGHHGFHILLGCVAALAGFFASAEISHQFSSSVPVHRHTAELFAVVIMLSLAIGLSWSSPLSGTSASVTLIALMVAGAIAWGPQYLDIDPMGLEPREVLAFGSQQLTTAALLPALVLPSLLRWSTDRSRAGRSRVPDDHATASGVVPTTP